MPFNTQHTLNSSFSFLFLIYFLNFNHLLVIWKPKVEVKKTNQEKRGIKVETVGGIARWNKDRTRTLFLNVIHLNFRATAGQQSVSDLFHSINSLLLYCYYIWVRAAINSFSFFFSSKPVFVSGDRRPPKINNINNSQNIKITFLQLNTLFCLISDAG